MRSLFLSRSPGLVIALLLTACGPSQNPEADAGDETAVDGGHELDAGAPAADAGLQIDAGAPAIDAGQQLDAGAPADDGGGARADAGALHDGGGDPLVDAGAADAGGPIDAGLPLDAGQDGGGPSDGGASSICNAGQVDELGPPCGLNGSGTEDRLCVDGGWSSLGTCSNDPDECVNGDERYAPDVPCGPNGLGAATEGCQAGQWTFAGVCDVCGASVFDGDVTIASADDLAALEGVNHITGDLRFNVPDGSQADFSGLEALSCVDGALRVTYAPDFASFEGLDNLLEVGRLEVISVYALQSLEGLGQLRVVHGDVLIRNSGLLNLSGAAQLERVEGSLEIYSNPQLGSLDGLEGLQTVDDKLVIAGENLTSIEALSSLESVGSLTIGRTDAEGCGANSEATGLPSLTGLENLTTLTGSGPGSYNDPVAITCSPALVDVSALAALWPYVASISEELNRPVRIVGTGLPSVDGMEGLTHIRDLQIHDNDALVDLGGLSGLLEADTLELVGNENLPDLSGLSNLEEVLELELRQNHGMVSLAGLSSLSTIGLELRIVDQAGLSSLDGLQSLATPGFDRFDLVLWNLPLLGDLSALSGITQLDSLRVQGPLAAENLVGLHNLTSVEQIGSGPVVWIEDADNLTTLDGLGALETVSRGLRITSCDALQDLSALNTLTTVLALEIIDNPLLEDLQGLEQITGLGPTVPSLRVQGNATLSSLSGLDGLTVATGLVIIEDNPQLLGLSGLEQLNIAERVELRNNQTLVDLSALEGVEQLEQLRIENHPALTTMPKFTTLTVMDALHLNGATTLTAIDDLGSLEAIAHITLGDPDLVVVDDVPVLADLSGFSGLSDVTNVHAIHLRNHVSLSPLAGTSGVNWTIEDSVIGGLDGMAGTDGVANGIRLIAVETATNDLSGLQGLSTVNGSVWIDSTTLQTLEGLGGLVEVSGSLWVEANDDLTSITSVYGLEVLGNTLRILDNPLLPRCQAQALLDDLVDNHDYPYGGSANLTGNDEVASCP